MRNSACGANHARISSSLAPAAALAGLSLTTESLLLRTPLLLPPRAAFARPNDEAWRAAAARLALGLRKLFGRDWVAEKARLAVPRSPEARLHGAKVIKPFDGAPIGVVRVVENVGVGLAPAVAVDERGRRLQPRARVERARTRQEQCAVEEHGDAQRGAKRGRLFTKATHAPLGWIVP